MSGHLLVMENISKSFPGVKALERVSFTLNRGEVHAVVGKNGAGKSTLMKILSGAMRPDSGTITLKEESVHFANPHQAHRHGIAIVYQELSLVPSMTVAENLFLGRLPRKSSAIIDWGGLRSQALGLLKRLHSGIPPFILVKNLSVAKQQIVEIAKALAQHPKIMILDEPTSSLADDEAEQLLTLVKSLAAQGVGIIYISHRLAEVEKIADQITVLRDGETVGSLASRNFDRSKIVSLMLGQELQPLTEAGNTGQSHSTNKVLSVHNLSRKGALHDISFDLHEGEILGIAGLVGAGRTELVRAIFGVDPINQGEIYINDKPIKSLSPRSMKQLGVGFAPEDRKAQGLILGMTVRENIAITVLRDIAPRHVIQPSRERRTVATFIKKLGIKTASPNVLVRNLSGGNQQKVVLAKWLAIKPRILILDEPTRGIDVGAKAQIFDILRKLAQEGVSVIFISSELEEVLAVSHRIITMARGCIVSEQQSENSNLQQILLAAAGG